MLVQVKEAIAWLKKQNEQNEKGKSLEVVMNRSGEFVKPRLILRNKNARSDVARNIFKKTKNMVEAGFWHEHAWLPVKPDH